MRILRNLAAALTVAASLGAGAPAQAAIAFKDHPATEHHRGTPKPIDLSSDALVGELPHRWRDILREEARMPPNFAGAYRIVEVGCGTGCQQIYVISSATGRIYRLAEGATYGVRYRLGSRLLVVAADPVHKLPARYFVFERGAFRAVR